MPSVGQCVYLSVESEPTLKGKAVPAQAAVWKNIEDIVLSERRQALYGRGMLTEVGNMAGNNQNALCVRVCVVCVCICVVCV